MSPTVALATAAEARGLDLDEPALVAALADLDVEAVPAAWDDPAIDWSAFDLVIVRSTWDYPRRHREFLAWAAHVESVTKLRNPAAILEWNTDKRYLVRLERAGLPTVPTVWAPPGREPAITNGAVVVKPVVSAGSRDTARYTAQQHDDAVAHVRRLHAQGRAAIVQPYLPELAGGELALVFVHGEYSHSVIKQVSIESLRSTGRLFAPEQLHPVEATAAERSLAEQAIAALVTDPRDLLYARADLVRGGSRGLLLLEVELTEPSLFLKAVPGATQRFAAAVAQDVATTRDKRDS